MSEIAQIIEMINQTGGIPLVITQTTTTNYFQFITTILLSSFAVIFLFGSLFKQGISNSYGKIMLKLFKRKNRLNHILVIKHTSSDLFNQSMINQSTMKKIQQALIKFKGKPFDLVLWTPGGEIFSAIYISRMLRKYNGKIRSFVPIYSMSGGTLLALSTDEIYMNDVSCLGAVDPQLGNLFRFGSARSWKEIIKLKGKKAEDQSISFKYMGEQYTKSMRENIKELLSDKVDKKNLNKITNLLTSGEIEHGFNLTKDILKNQGLTINDIPDETNIKLIKLIRHISEGVTYN
jgi:ClpP class serine protease